MVAFFVSMEWTGQQQIQFLLRSIILGVLQGLCLDLITSLLAGRKRRRWLWTDVLFGPLAAIITFFGALVIMDGQLHPLLFLGIALGMLAEHVTIGTLISFLLLSFIIYVFICTFHFQSILCSFHCPAQFFQRAFLNSGNIASTDSGYLRYFSLATGCHSIQTIPKTDHLTFLFCKVISQNTAQILQLLSSGNLLKKITILTDYIHQ